MGKPGADSGVDAARDAQIGAILNEFFDRRANGEPVSEAEFLARHPDLADELRGHFAVLGDLRPTADRIGGLIAQGLLHRSSDPRYLAELGPYRISGFLGRGGVGLVLRALDVTLGREIALKILRPELADDAVALERFEREARAAAALRHPNIVTVHAVGALGATHYLAMELVRGANLAQLLRRVGPLPAAVCRRIFRELLAGLDAAHAAGLIHRDIKSANVLLDGWPSATPDDSPLIDGLEPPPGPFVKIADFGLAQMRAAQTRITLPAAVLGTPEYMSPEQARGADGVDARSDLYSAGVVLYEMLAGRTPFAADSVTATLHRVSSEDAVSPLRITPAADPHLAAIALRLLAKSPDDRYMSATAAAAALDDPRASGVWAALRRRRRRVRSAVPALAGLAALAGLVWWWSDARTPAAARVDPEEPGHVQVRRGRSLEWESFARLRLPPGVAFRAPTIAQDAGGRTVLAVGASGPIDSADNGFLAFDPDGRELWRRVLGSSWTWPEVLSGSPWGVMACEAGDLDGRPGDELLVTAVNAFEYPTRIAILDPRTGRISASFWHIGQVAGTIVADLLGPGRPGVVCWGVNNKLDGFESELPPGLPPDEPPRTVYDWVPIVAVLDPAPDWFDGLGPPRTGRIPALRPARPWAYAFLDVPVSVRGGSYQLAPGGPRIAPRATDTASIARLTAAPHGDRIALYVDLVLGGHEHDPRGVLLQVDANLALTLDGITFSTRDPDRDESYWLDRWRIVYQNGGPLPYRAPTVPPSVTTDSAPDTASVPAAWIDEHRPTRVLARDPHTGATRVLREFGNPIAGVAVALPAPADSPIVIVGLTEPDVGGAVVGLDATGRTLWTLDLSPEFAWPDCGPPARWRCLGVLAGDADGRPGDEVFVTARDMYEYPTRVAQVDPRTGAVRASFWHYGEIVASALVPGYFADGRPALLAFGLNNKLDGFNTPQPGDDPPVTAHAIVSVAMILDPLNLDGVGPPASARLPHLRAAAVHAYALLDTPAIPPAGQEPHSPETGDAPPMTPIVRITSFRPAAYAARAADEPWFVVGLQRSDSIRGPGTLVVDRNLAPQDFIPATGLEAQAKLALWGSHWRVLARDGRFAGPVAPAASLSDTPVPATDR